ncbi:SRPBCC family protein [Streptomyces morookaense]|uniref:SRPBCC family protein n=1 Tax=Streptomyces morookaense TaxID=1970 RepID=A0A7Y7B2Q3_STRMO|nr:SRPBCC family protein [Streptomyces morookaense]NVK77872.1 SRPBCC family protein [Streptomyces morookaense]
MARRWTVEESILVRAPRARLYSAVADVRAMGRWSPECRAVWVPHPPLRAGRGFFGFNRKGPFVWFTWCRVVRAEHPREFAFDVSTFGLPVARWGYRFETVADAGADGSGGGDTKVTEYWQDLRTGPGARFTELLGLVFTGTPAARRAEANRAGMRITLRRIKDAVER